jgi:hypothetical protein
MVGGGEGILPPNRGQAAHDTQGRDALATTGFSLHTGHCVFSRRSRGSRFKKQLSVAGSR